MREVTMLLATTAVGWERDIDLIVAGLSHVAPAKAGALTTGLDFASGLSIAASR
jgi:hypothetical protein